MTTPTCPDRRLLAEFTAGKLDEPSSDQIAVHLEQCTDCQSTIVNLAGDQDTVGAALRKVAQTPTQPAGAAVEKALRSAAQMIPPLPTSKLTASAATSGGPTVTLTLEQFARSLSETGVVDGDELTAARSRLTAEQRDDAQALARELIAAGRLTKFQALNALQGKAKGLVFGEHVVLDRIGAGGMGQVFKAKHRRMDRIVALKVLSPSAVKNADSVRRFEREVRAAAKLMHPNIVTAHDAGVQDGVHYLVMEYVEGPDLSSLLKKQGKLPIKQACDYIAQAARGFAFAHSKGIVHRDIKPGNLLVDKDGTVKVLDMGLARFDDGGVGGVMTEGELTQSGAVMGTVDYMAPEQAMNTRNADAKSDVYGLGCSLYRLLTGESVYGGQTMVEKIMAHREQPIPVLRKVRPEAPPALEVLVMSMLAKDPAERPTMQGVADALVKIDAMPAIQTAVPVATPATAIGLAPLAPARGEGPGVRNPAAKLKPASIAPPRKRSNTPMLVAAGAGAVLIALGVWFIIRDKDGNEIARVQGPDGSSVQMATDPGPQKLIAPPTTPSSPTPTGTTAIPSQTTSVDPIKMFALPSTTGTPTGENSAVERAAAEKVLSRGGVISIVTDAKPTSSQVRAVADLPAVPFAVNTLDWNRTGASDADFAVVQGLAKIVILRAPNANLTDAGLAHVSRLTTLTELTLPGNRITDAGLGYLYGLTNLKTLNLNGTQVTPAGVAALQAKLPSCTIIASGTTSPTASTTVAVMGGNAGDLWIYPESFNQQQPLITVPSLHYDGSSPLTIEAWVVPKVTPEMTKVNAVISAFGFEDNLQVTWQLSSANKSSRNWKFRFSKLSPDQKPSVIHKEVGGGFSQEPRHVAVIVRPHGDANGNVQTEVWSDGKRVYNNGGRLFSDPQAPLTSAGFLREMRVSKVARYSDDFTPQPRWEPDADTIALYHCDEGSGDRLIDSSGNNRHGQLVNAAWAPTGTPPGVVPVAAQSPVATNNPPPAAPTVPNPASGDLYLYGDPFPTRPCITFDALHHDPDAAETIEGWCIPIVTESLVTRAAGQQSKQQTVRIFGIDPFTGISSQMGWLWVVDGSQPDGDFWRFDSSKKTGKNEVVDGLIAGRRLPATRGRQQHFAIVHHARQPDGNQLQTAWLDGKKVAHVTGPHTCSNTMPYISQGFVDEIRVSKVARYTTDFAPQRRFEPDADTIALYHCDEGSGTQLIDSSGNGLHAALTNSVKWAAVPGSTAPVVAAPVTTASGAAGGWVDLFALVDPVADVVAGPWNNKNGGFTVGPDEAARLVLPVEPTGSYEMEFEFTRVTGSTGIVFFIPLGREIAVYMLADAKNDNGMRWFDGVRAAADNPTKNHDPVENGKRTKMAFEVRWLDKQASVVGKLNDKVILDWQGEKRQIDAMYGVKISEGVWRLPPKRWLGLGASKTQLNFHSARIRALEGELKPARPGVTLPSTAPSPANVPIAAGNVPPAVAAAAPGGDLWLYADRFDGNRPTVTVDSIRFDGTSPLTIECWAMPVVTTALQGYFKNTTETMHTTFAWDRELGSHPQFGMNWVSDGVDPNKDHWINSRQRWSGGKVGGMTSRSLGQVVRDKPVHLAITVGTKVDKLQSLKVWVDGKLNGGFESEYEYFPDGKLLSRGSFDELRVSQGVRYTKDFIPQRRFTPDADTIALYHCDEGAGDTLIDASGNNRHGKLMNAKWAPHTATTSAPAAAPIAPAAMPTSTARGGEVDLLALVQLPRDAVRGNWTRNGESMSIRFGRGQQARLQVPYTPTGDEYDLVLNGQMTSKDQRVAVHFGLVRQGKQFHLRFGRESAGLSDGDSSKLPYYAEYPALTLLQPFIMVVEVRRTGLRGLFNGVEKFRYDGNFADVLGHELPMPRLDQMFLGLDSDSSFDFTSYKLKPVGGPPTAVGGFTPPSMPVATVPAARQKLPETKDQVPTLALIKDVYKDDYLAARMPDKKSPFASKLLQQAATVVDPIERYVLLAEARTLAADGDDPQVMKNVLSAIVAGYDVEPGATFIDGWKALLAKSRPASVARVVYDDLAARLDDAVTRADFDTAKKFGEYAVVVAPRVGDAVVTKLVRERNVALAARQQEYAAAKAAIEKLESTPDDAEANLLVGRYRALVESDWQNAFPLLAKGSDPLWKELAAQSVAVGNHAGSRITVADAWWDAAQAKPALKPELTAAALYWYQAAVGQLSGLQKARVEKRIADAAAVVPPRKIPPTALAGGELATVRAGDTGLKGDVPKVFEFGAPKPSK